MILTIEEECCNFPISSLVAAVIVYIITFPHSHDKRMHLEEKQEGEKCEKRMGAVEDVQWEAYVQLFPQGNVDPYGNLLLAGCSKKIALARHCKYSNELKMSSTYSSGLK